MSSPLGGFVALLRAAGLGIGPDRLLLAHQALALTGLCEREPLRAALRSTLCCHADELPLFDAAFALYWRDPGARLQDLLPTLPPQALLRPRKPGAGGPPRRLLEAIAPPHAWQPAGEQRLRIGASAAGEGRRGALAEAGAEELRQARERVRWLREQLGPPPPSRRWRAAADGRLHLAAALRRLQAGRPLLPLPRRRPQRPPPTLIWLLDASGSMQEPLRELLLWAHALSQQAAGASQWRFWAFAGTRLQALTPLLRREPDADAALRALADAGFLQGGGTRIAEALRQLLVQEGPRLAAGRCSLLLLSDGLDHDPEDPALPVLLAAWRQRGVRLLWLDPLGRRQHLGASAALAAGVDARLAL